MITYQSSHRLTEKPAHTRRATLAVPAYGQTWRIYYYAGAQTIALRVMTATVSMSTLYYLHTDHLGSTSVTTCGHVNCGTLGAVLSRHSYYPYGEVRQQSGVPPTRRTFTGQEDVGLGGLMFYNARFYSVSLGRSPPAYSCTAL